MNTGMGVNWGGAHGHDMFLHGNPTHINGLLFGFIQQA